VLLHYIRLIHRKLKKHFFIGKIIFFFFIIIIFFIIRSIFDQIYPDHEHLTPYMWLPKWCGDQTDPSARVLKHYKEQQGDGDKSK